MQRDQTTHEEHTHHEHADHEAHAGHAGHAADQDHSAHAGHSEHSEHSGHDGHSDHSAHGPASWRMAAMATIHCLTGCAIGEVLGMLIGTALGWNNAQTMILAIVLAFVFGYSLTMRGVLRAGLDLRAAFRVALAADTVSIILMELADNGTILVFPGAMDATLSDALFWVSLALSFVVAFVVTTPVNKWLIGRGKGHAVVHAFH
ncbi:DUF4396 domain-containing protein [Streptomyces sp. H10-C2]|uniref:DUF4396 domain-containing protein n=1 Tax=unclassified Streptomyces TaxID=2593676 RepID=UPI0024BA4B3A|nr:MULTISPECIES: DUF4396 domain-containing protein [unclassified Streptomyces]MDJ0341111.1 DUF4396 domain-containing protein [Streptomyces sp. PH10-H1]MDJ0369537.1 DUF4396 domain-containing protein [Streptomyces sp. H10-C2]